MSSRDTTQSSISSSSNTPVQITIPEGSTRFKVENATQQINSILKDELSWQDPDAGYKKRNSRTNWDGYHHLYETTTNTAPIGLADRAKEVLEQEGYTVQVSEESDNRGKEILPRWRFDHDLRDYQNSAVTETLSAAGGIISVPTGGGKTVIAMALIKTIGKKSIVFVHTKELLYQWANQVEETLGITPGLIGDGEWSEGDITIATMQTLDSRGLEDLSDDYGMAIFDECHRTSAAQTMYSIGLDIDVNWRIGLSATPWRDTPGEEMKIEAVTGNTAYEIGADHLIEKGYLAKPEFEFLSVEDQTTASRSDEYHDAVRKCIELCPNRNGAIAQKAAELAENDYTVFVSVDRIAQGKLIEYALSPRDEPAKLVEEITEADDDNDEKYEKGKAVTEMPSCDDHNVVFLQGSDSKETREEILESFQNGDIDIVVSTLLKEGVNIPEISAIIHGEGGKSKIEKIQRVGRALRPSNGDHAKIVDIADKGKYLKNHYEHRLNTLKDYYGEYGPGGGFSNKVQAVRDYLKDHDVNVEACSFEEQQDGSVTIELVDYLGGDEFSKFRSATQQASGISYNGDLNICKAQWVDSLVVA
jgi:superfamily II DNA or RNA helicase